MKKGPFLNFLVLALAVHVQSKPHGGKEHGKLIQTPKTQSESMQIHKHKDGLLPTLVVFESSTPDEEISEEGRVEMKKVDHEELGESDGGEKNTPLLLSEEALTKLLQERVKEDNDDETMEKGDGVKEDEKSETEDEEEIKEEDSEEIDTSKESEIPMDLDYAANEEASEPLQLEEDKASSSGTMEVIEETAEDVVQTATSDYDSQQSNTGVKEEKEELVEQSQDELNELTNKEKTGEQNEMRTLTSDFTGFSGGKKSKKEKKKPKNEGKGKKSKKQRSSSQELEMMQSDQAVATEATEEAAQKKNPEKNTDPTENTEVKARKKNGKWSRLVGMNPVQIRATMELYPDIRFTNRPSGQGEAADPCENFRCKRGKTCKMNDENKPVCVCQEPSECPHSVNDFEHVCGTDNKTYDSSCQLFATKCGLEGTKVGHRLHLDYSGSCKFIAPCLEPELVQFPLRMRDWLKNVLLQLYEHDSMSPGFLTAKQRIRVTIVAVSKPMEECDHPVELLQQDFKKNYNMYIYPVHWQFAQMDQHPSDRFLSHSELAPLRVPLVPMEHCTSVFFQKCDADKDKLVSFKEWCSCFGIKEDDMNDNLLF
ncbi:hypothetical protein DNTS_026331 [Danionella cerebrum]|uniref:Kazal-like domain-containing protein n=1 Tax=Danionella cerebrum TaxID=2873325 RepID=A0A553QWI0_9TELE|nr:hypothetical protein DNTS_026331 [Danionella translucida]